MTKAIKKPVEIEFITFEDFVEYGKQNSTNIAENGMPWSFDYKGHPISHETDEAYVVPTLEGTLLFTPNDVLITGVKGEIYPCRKDIFEATYSLVNNAEEDNFLSRLKKEREELAARTQKLGDFLAKFDDPDAISPAVDFVQRQLLRIQFDAMRTYLRVMTARLESMPQNA